MNSDLSFDHFEVLVAFRDIGVEFHQFFVKIVFLRFNQIQEKEEDNGLKY